ncbi:OmpL47-type beta-barrel domain-containing protein [Microbispora sp. H10836]|uniref:OmpL47-type beta-barrel domain-containing protein n=1 Tax=Microbispora sp. H10836 TaxID=2729106 RepID=UPI001B8D3FB1|nr:chitobiase/beta-hexosaminidase C-terminal domain-containing protein [Microbispora sp. H10836]
MAVVMLAVALPMLWLPVGASAQSQSQNQSQSQSQKINQAAAQVLLWTADNSYTAFKSAPTTATAGPATIIFETSPATGNTFGMTHTLTFDASTPGYNHDVNVNIIASPFDTNGGRHEVQVNLTPGKYRYFCAIPGHGEMVGELVVTAGGPTDTTAPQVSANVSGEKDVDGNYVGSATVTVSATDSESGVDKVEYALDGGAFTTYSAPVSVNQVGSHTVQYRATDKAGNASAVASVSFKVVAPPAQDKTAPQVSAQVTGDKDTDGNYVGSATVTITATDSESGVDTTEYSIDGQPFALYTKALEVNQPGKHTVSYRATDKAGNTSNVESVTFTVADSGPKDTTPPTVSASVSGTKDADGNYVSSATVTITAADTESGVDKVEYSLDDGAFQAYTAPVSVNQLGKHTVRYRAADKAGNASEAGSVTFTVVAPKQDDTTPPTVSAQLTGSMDWAWNYVGSATLTITATDSGSGVDTIEYSADGQPFALYTKPLVIDQPGEHTVSYRATDKAGNTSDVATATFTVVVAPPTAKTPLTVTAASRCIGTSAYLAVTAVNDGDVPATIELNTPFGTKTVADVAPGKQAYQSFNTRAKQIDAGKVTVTGTSFIDGKKVTSSYEADYNAISCG